MKRKITLAVLALFTSTLSLHAQGSYVHRVIVLNEGHYDYTNQIQLVPVTVGAYNPSTHSYMVFDTIQNARFASHVLVDGSSIYVAADNQLIRYDADTYQRLATTTVQGIRKVTVWNNQLLVSRGEYLQTFTSYFQVFDKNNLSFQYALPTTAGPQYASEGIVVKNNVAYIAINNGFDYGNEVGLIGRVDLVNQTYINEINLGVGGKNPENIILDNNNIYTVNNTDYTTASISNIDIASQTVNTVNLNTSTGCGASGFTPGYIMFQVAGDARIGRFSTSTFSMHDTLMINRTIYGMATDEVNNLIYAGETDYTSYGKIFVYDFTGATVDSFNVSIAPGNIAMDVRSTAGIHETTNSSNHLSCYPNPANDRITILSSGTNLQNDVFILSDVTGREVKRIATDRSSFVLDVHSLEAGIYILQSATNANEKVKIVKQ